MSNNQPPSPAPDKKHRWLKIFGGIGGILILLLIVAYFVVTSAGFFKSFILPRVSQAAHATVTVESAAISPFSQIVLRNLKVQTTGSEPLVAAPEVRVRYHLMAILGGHIDVEEITLASPTVNIVENADGTSNLDPLLKAQPEKETKPATKSAPRQINLKKLLLTGATIRQTKSHSGGARETTELANVNVTLTDLKNGQSGKLVLGADVKIDQQAAAPAASGSLQAKIAGEFTFALAADLKPLSITGNTHLAVTQAGGALAELTALAADLDCEVTPTEIKNVALRFQKSGAALGGLHVSGPFDVEKSEGRFNVELLALDRQVLNLAGAASGLDFGGTTISSTNLIELTKAGAVITASGQFTAARLQVTRAAQSTPVLDLRADYRVTVDRTAQSALLQTLTINATQNQSPLVHAELSSPMNLSWGNAASTAGDAALEMSVTGLNLADWRAFATDLAPAGNVSAKLKLISQQGGKQLVLDLDSTISELSAKLGNQVISNADVHVEAKGRATDLKQFSLASYRLELAQRGEPALTVSGTGTFDSATQEADLQVAVQSALARLLAILPQPGMNLRGGTLDFKGRVASKAQSQSIKGNLVLADLVMNSEPGKPLAAKLQLDASVSQHIAELRQCQLTLTPTDRAKNQLTLTGQVNLTQPSAITGNLKLVADTLDVTGYYDLFGGKSATQPAPVAPVAPREQEPEAVKLPFKDFTVDATIARLYLHEVDVADFQTTLKLDGGKVLLQPFQMSLNGAPVKATADLNLGVPGYQYDVKLDADGVPLTPLVNTFQPERKGKLGGTAVAHMQIKGAGTLGASLKNNLTGQFEVTTTNMNLAIVNVRSPLLRTLVNTIAAVPDLLRNPAAALTGIVGGVLGGKTDAGWTGKLASAPIDTIVLRGKAGDGKIQVQQGAVQSKSFLAEAAGSIAIADVLTNSTINIPVTVSLERALAQQINIVAADTNAAYAALPQFLTMTGTVGVPRSQIDKLALGKVALKTGSGIWGAFQNAGSTNAPSGTNQPTQQQQINKGIDALQGLFGKPKK